MVPKFQIAVFPVDTQAYPDIQTSVFTFLSHIVTILLAFTAQHSLKCLGNRASLINYYCSSDIDWSYVLTNNIKTKMSKQKSN